MAMPSEITTGAEGFGVKEERYPQGEKFMRRGKAGQMPGFLLFVHVIAALGDGSHSVRNLPTQPPPRLWVCGRKVAPTAITKAGVQDF